MNSVLFRFASPHFSSQKSLRKKNPILPKWRFRDFDCPENLISELWSNTNKMLVFQSSLVPFRSIQLCPWPKRSTFLAQSHSNPFRSIYILHCRIYRVSRQVWDRISNVPTFVHFGSFWSIIETHSFLLDPVGETDLYDAICQFYCLGFWVMTLVPQT